MELIDEIKQDRERLRGKSWKEKASHILTYYKFPILVVLIATCVIVSWICARVTDTDTALSGIFLNSFGRSSMLSEEDQPAFSEDFLDVLSLDRSDYSLSFRMNLTYFHDSDSAADSYSDYQSLMTIMSYVAAGELDFITGDLGAMLGLAYQGYFVDLSQVLGQEQYERYAACFLYIDEAVLEQVNTQSAEAGPTDLKIPDCTRPEDMERPVPVLLDMSRSEKLRKVYLDDAQTLAFGMIGNMPHPENTLKFIDYLMP